MMNEPEVIEGAGELVQQMASATSITAYDKVEAGLNEVRGRLANIVHDVKTPAGMKAARADRWECVKLRTSLEDMRKAVKAPALRYGKLVDSEAARIRDAILQLESPIDAAITAHEEAQAAAKAAEAERERTRQAAILNRLDWIRSRPFDVLGKPAAEVGAVLEQVESLPITVDLYAERLDEAAALRKVVADQLRDMAAKTMLAEAEAKRLADERAALEQAQAKQREEDAARERRHRAEDEARAAKQRAEDEARAASERIAIALKSALHELHAQLTLLAETHTLDVLNGAMRYAHSLRAPEGANTEQVRLFQDERAAVFIHLQAQIDGRKVIDAERARQEQAKRDARAELERAADPWAALEGVRKALNDVRQYDTRDCLAEAFRIVEAAFRARAALEQACNSN